MENLFQKTSSIYIHIPFCDQICSYCDFPKFLKNDQWVDQYLKALNQEFDLKYKGEVIRTIYIGGGTPLSLNIDQLSKLFSITSKVNKSSDYEFTVEGNSENITLDKVELLVKNGVNRVSIGVETFKTSSLTYLNRRGNYNQVKTGIELLKNNGITNINIDLMYAIQNETIADLESDLEQFLSLDIPHISTYSLIIEKNTKLYIDKTEYIDSDLDYKMYLLICDKLKQHGFIHYEISNFAKDGYESKHNLTYWNNQEYYGFGLGSGGYVRGIRYNNTRSFNQYISGHFTDSSYEVSIQENIENAFILGLRKIRGINKIQFQRQYHRDIYDIKPVQDLVSSNKLMDDGMNIFINPEYLYVENDILVEFIN